AVKIVPALARIETASELHAADRGCVELDAGAVELTTQKTIVEARVVRDKNPTGEALMEIGGELGKARRLRQHLGRDAGEHLDLGRQRAPRIDERRPFRDHLEARDLDDADLGDAI